MFFPETLSIVDHHSRAILPSIIHHRTAVFIHAVLNHSPGPGTPGIIGHGNIKHRSIGNVVYDLPCIRLFHDRHISVGTIGIIPASHIFAVLIVLLVKGVIGGPYHVAIGSPIAQKTDGYCQKHAPNPRNSIPHFCPFHLCPFHLCPFHLCPFHLCPFPVPLFPSPTRPAAKTAFHLDLLLLFISSGLSSGLIFYSRL